VRLVRKVEANEEDEKTSPPTAAMINPNPEFDSTWRRLWPVLDVADGMGTHGNEYYFA